MYYFVLSYHTYFMMMVNHGILPFLWWHIWDIPSSIQLMMCLCDDHRQLCMMTCMFMYVFLCFSNVCIWRGWMDHILFHMMFCYGWSIYCFRYMMFMWCLTYDGYMSFIHDTWRFYCSIIIMICIDDIVDAGWIWY